MIQKNYIELESNQRPSQQVDHTLGVHSPDWAIETLAELGWAGRWFDSSSRYFSVVFFFVCLFLLSKYSRVYK